MAFDNLPPPQMTSTQAAVLSYVIKNYPHIIQEAQGKLKKTEPAVNNFFMLERAMLSFCRLKGVEVQSIIGKGVGEAGMWNRNVFIGVIIKLYSPEVFSGHFPIMHKLRQELSAMLQCDKTSISQKIPDIISYMNEKNFVDFKNQVNEYSEYLKEELKK